MNFVNNIIKSIVGDKSKRDLKSLEPRIKVINQEFEKLKNLTNNEFRLKSFSLREEIKEEVSEFDSRIAELKMEANQTSVDDAETLTAIYEQIDNISKDKNKALEKKLDAVLPVAFAIMKETARRFKENNELTVDATERDRELVSKKVDFLEITDHKAVYKNEWTAGGGKIKWDMVHYDVQLIGGMVLHGGKIAEMATGEGKTLVSTLPAYLNALSGEGVHIVTVNDYLAKRDSEWMRPIYEFLGVSVDCIENYQSHSEGRKNAYRADITYGTNNEFGFDYLRDNMAQSLDDIVQRGHHFAMVDEVDSVLIDDARTPLIISGPTPKGDQQQFSEIKPSVEKLVNAQKTYVNKALARVKELFAKSDSLSKEEEKEMGILLLRCYRGLPKNKALIKFLSETGAKAVLQKTENFYLQEQQKNMPEVDKELYFVIDEKNNSVDLSDKGIELISTNSDPEFFVLPDVGSKIADIEKKSISPEEKLREKDELMQAFSEKSERVHTINQLLKAYTLFEKDVEYILDGGKIKIVDEQTGRVMEGRRYSDGLHQAIEAKENVKVEAATQTYATVTLQNYFRMYHKLCGMTGTAETEAGEFWQIYKLDVIAIPTNKPIIRNDKQDLVFKTRREKYNAAIDEIVKLSEAGRPVLVGTTSVEISELLSRMLKIKNIKHNVLNAKQHDREAQVVAEAGLAGNVTIATNMAGRGTDIKLGFGVKAAGGLAIVGTERHESRRVDRQLRGRSGRQGDPGSTQFFVSLEDDLMRLFGSERISKIMDRLGHKEGEVLQHGMISKSIERAQKKVEQNNFGIRKRLLEYDDVMNAQREVIYKRRRNALYGERLKVDISNMLDDISASLVSEFKDTNDFEGFTFEVMRNFAIEVPFTKEEFENGKTDDLIERFGESLFLNYDRKNKHIRERVIQVVRPVYDQNGDKIENVVVPFSEGNKLMQVPVNLKQCIDTEASALITEVEKSVTLSIIDNAWKEHLRELDDLRQSVQNAVYEQKDPLLIYKFESFELFQKLVNEINKELLSTLFRVNLHSTPNESQVKEHRELPKQRQQLKTQRADMYQTSSTANGNQGFAETDTQEQVREKIEPVKVGEKTGRNEPCPCGSGKKFKNCHGRD
jgi:preprotein translocase subunit SecA